MKKIFWIVILTVMAVGFISAQDFGFGFGLQKASQNIIDPFGYKAGLFSGFNTGLQPDLFAAEGRQPIIDVPLFAGLLNTPLGLWCWVNQDWVGGGITAGMETLIFVAFLLDSDLLGLIGFITTIVGPIYGFFRGYSVCKKMNAALAWTGNPLDHIILTAMPAPDGGLTGTLSFKASF